MKSNVILIGMPGSGKSTLGVILAKVIAHDFIDLDILICKRTGQTLQAILNTQGTDAFLKIERDTALSLRCERTVIATGGSAALIDEAMVHLRQNGVTVFLDVPPAELERRLTNMKTRGIAADPNKTVADIYAERLPFYKKHADITIDAADFSDAEQTVASIVARLKAFGLSVPL